MPSPKKAIDLVKTIAENMRKAQINATKMLGLPPDNTPMDRARAMGFDTDVMHGTGYDDITAFELKKAQDKEGRKLGLGLGKGKIYTSANPSAASSYAEDSIMRGMGESPTVYPMMTRANLINQDDYDKIFEELSGGIPRYSRSLDKATRDRLISNTDKQIKKMGYQGIAEYNKIGPDSYAMGQVAVTDPSMLRSRFAAFDPARINENDLLAGVVAAPLGLLDINYTDK